MQRSMEWAAANAVADSNDGRFAKTVQKETLFANTGSVVEDHVEQ
jgi:hypothetical protein